MRTDLLARPLGLVVGIDHQYLDASPANCLAEYSIELNQVAPRRFPVTAEKIIAPFPADFRFAKS